MLSADEYVLGHFADFDDASEYGLKYLIAKLIAYRKDALATIEGRVDEINSDIDDLRKFVCGGTLSEGTVQKLQ